MSKKNVTKKQVIEALKTVMDPELGINVVDLGLIYEIRIRNQELGNNRNKGAGTVVTVVMTLTTPGCPLIGVFEGLVNEAVKKVEGVEEVDTELVWEPAWSPNKMSEEAKAELGFNV